MKGQKKRERKIQREYRSVERNTVHGRKLWKGKEN
jgi:hypothetical protein